MIKKALVILTFTSTIIGCSIIDNIRGTLPIPLSLVRSPITVKNFFWAENGPIEADVRYRLNLAAEAEVIEETNQFDKHGTSRPSAADDLLRSIDFDSFHDLCQPAEQVHGPNTLFFVAISGGGARATALASHALAILENKYNDYSGFSANSDFKPLIDRIAAFSSVSGGSIYTYQVAQLKTLLDDATNSLHSKKQRNTNDEGRNATYASLFEQRVTYSDGHIKQQQDAIALHRASFFSMADAFSNAFERAGIFTSNFYFSPGNLFMGLFATLFSDINYLHHLSFGLNFLSLVQNEFDVPPEIRHGASNMPDATAQTRTKTPILPSDYIDGYLRTFNPAAVKLSDLTEKPRFYFNATILETGLPFIFTQRKTHLPTENLFSQTARLDLKATQNANANDLIISNLKPLGGTTLEEINSDPATVPLAFAAAASAAFPLGVEPLELRKYGYHPSYVSIYKSKDILHIADGGIFDNSGLTTLIDLIEHLANVGCVHRDVAILAINADADSHDPYYPQRDPEFETFQQEIPLTVGAPIRWRALGVEALDRIHFTNKRRAEAIAIRRIKEIQSRIGEDYGFYYFPISLSQLSSSDEYRLPDPSNLYQRLQEIPTNYHVSEEESALLAQAARLIIESEQRGGWDVYDSARDRTARMQVKVNRLGNALMQVLLH